MNEKFFDQLALMFFSSHQGFSLCRKPKKKNKEKNPKQQKKRRICIHIITLYVL